MNTFAKLLVVVLVLAGAVSAVAWANAADRHPVQMTANDSFAPRNVNVDAGDAVIWTNRDSHSHTVHVDVGSGPDSDAKFPNGVPPGVRFLFRVPLNAPSGKVYYYHCRFHGSPGNGESYGTGMVGSITVR